MCGYVNSSDIHHCRCFKIDPNDIEVCKTKLIKLGFEKQILEENHGQVFGLRYKLLELLQIHFKVMPDGIIESELEPPPDYPSAHLNQKYSFPSHDGIQAVLSHVEIGYTTIDPIPETCKLSNIIHPDKPLKWWEFMIIGLIAVGLGYVLIQALKK